MTLSTDAGQKCQCPICRGIIKHGENTGAVDLAVHGVGAFAHSDCYKDMLGNESAQDTKWLNEEGRDVREQRVLQWANFKRLPARSQPQAVSGARRIA